MQVGFLRCHGGVGVGNRRRGQYQCSQGMIGWRKRGGNILWLSHGPLDQSRSIEDTLS